MAKHPKSKATVKTVKKASFRTRPKASKQAKTTQQHNYNNQKPSWRFSRLELVDPFGWHKLDIEKLHEIRSRLVNFETMTWNEILIIGKKRHHSIDTKDLCKHAQDRLEELRLDDIDSLVSLSLNGPGRIWGILQQSSLLLLWWDPDHQVCPSNMKHT